MKSRPATDGAEVTEQYEYVRVLLAQNQTRNIYPTVIDSEVYIYPLSNRDRFRSIHISNREILSFEAMEEPFTHTIFYRMDERRKEIKSRQKERKKKNITNKQSQFVCIHN